MSEIIKEFKKGDLLYIGGDEKAQWGFPEGYPYKEIGLNIEWDGNTKGLASISGIFYKISDVIPDNETLKNCFIEFYNKNTGVYSKVSVADKWDYMVSKGYVTENYVALEELGVVVKSPTDAMPETGIYFMGSSASYTSKLYTETIHLMDSNFFPMATSTTSGIVKQMPYLPNATGAAPTAEEFNALLKSLRDAGILVTE